MILLCLFLIGETSLWKKSFHIFALVTGCPTRLRLRRITEGLRNKEPHAPAMLLGYVRSTFLRQPKLRPALGRRN